MKRFGYALVFITLILSSCIGFNTLKVKKMNFEDEVQRAQNLVFTFNKNLLQDTSLMNKWDTTSYISFVPSISGRFMWTGKNELTFSPSGIMPPSTDFKASLSASIQKLSKTDFSISSDPIEFHTPYLGIAGVNSYWALSDDPISKIEVRLMLTFNNPVSPSKLKNHLHLEIKGKEIPFNLITLADNEVVEISLDATLANEEELAAGTIQITAGMPVVGGNAVLKGEVKQSFTLPSKDKLVVSELQTGFDQGKGILSVFTTQPVLAEGINGLVSTDPAVAFEIEMLPNGFVLKGDFKENQAYTLRLSPLLKSVFGRELGQEYIETVAFGTLEPFVGFVEKNATYLSSKGNRNLAINIINVPKVRVSVFKIFENNIQHYMRQGKTWEYVFDNDEYYDYYGFSFDENFGKPVMSREISTRSLPRSGNIALLNLDLSEIQFNDPFKGVYLVRVESTEKRWLQDVQMVSLSDLGLIVKEGSDDVMVFVNSLKDATPVKGAKVEFISNSNQKVHSVVTDNRGVAVFRNVKQAAADFKLGMVSVRYENDFNYLLFNSSKIETSRFDIGGKRTDQQVYDVFLYGDRNLYRPGDTMHLNAIVRTLKWESVRNIPIKFKLIAPGGKEISTQRKQLSANGTAGTFFYVPRQAMTGTYIMEAYSANNVLMASRRVSVEEFMPDRIKVATKTDKQVYQPGQEVKVDLLAENLYGTPAASRKAETELRLVRRNIQAKGFPDYDFNINLLQYPFMASVMQQATTDASGKASMMLKVGEFHDMGLLEGTLFTTVFDETARPVNRLNIIKVPTQAVFLGLKRFDQWMSTRKQMNFRIAAVDMNGIAAASSVAKVMISYYRYETVIEKGYNRYNYVSQKKETVMLSKEISIRNGTADLSFIPSRSGEYEIKLMLPGSENYVSASFYAYGWNDTDFTSFEVSRDGEILITADKAVYKPGEKARLLFKAPFDGEMLIAFEQNNVLDYKTVVLQNKSASFDLEIKSGHLPNIYVDATAFRKTTDDAIPLTVAHGIISLKVDDPSLKLNLAIKAPAKSRSGVKQLITVNAQPNTEVTIAVVDEGILQVTDYKSPDPYSWFFQKRALGVASYDVYGQLYPEMRPKSSMAGGEAFDLSRRINPLTGERVKLISKWSGVLRTNASGTCSYMLDIPQFSGALRVMVVGSRDNRFGSAEQIIKVADPIVISTGLPRFLSPGDEVTATVNLVNTTSSTSTAKIQVVTSGPVSVIGGLPAPVELKPNQEQSLTLSLRAAESIGNAEVKVIVSSMGQQFQQKITVPVRPASGLSFITGSGVIQGNGSKSLKLGAELIPSGTKTNLYLSKSPVMQFAGNLNELLRYPYGCLEQTVSCAFPQIYFRDLVKLVSKDQSMGNSFENPDFNVQQAVLKAESMQLYNGGFSLWEQGGVAQWWVSAYTSHFLLEAEKAGFEVNRKVLDASLRYLEQKAKEKEQVSWFYNENGEHKVKQVASPEIFYSLYVLALANQPLQSVMNFYKSQSSILSPESRYLLACTYMLTGDRKTYQLLLPKGFGNEQALPSYGGYLGSYNRELALTLNALLEADPNNPQVGVLLRQLTAELTKPYTYHSTQENAFALTAIGKQAKRAAASNVSASVSIDGKNVTSFKNDDLRMNSNFQNRNLTINSSGNGLLYYFYELSGIRAKAPKGSEDSYLKVRKRFFDRNGKEITSNRFALNDLVVVEVSAESAEGQSVENVAVTDLLPACFEIENSRILGERDMSWMKVKATPDYIDIRDDRVSYFCSLSNKPSVFYYVVRIVAKGKFTLGPVSADAMYDASCHSYSGSGIIQVN
ncbi:MAG: alpha-2-macroglobulin family protein [Bacteroidales bacterium]|nr:alpha-2-macroglobulin family protein [Bacteroidales bacterium]